MRVDSAKLQAALKRRYGTPRVLLQHLLGQDADLVAPGSGGDDAMRELRVGLENLIAKLNLPEGSVAKILSFLDGHIRLDKLSDDDPEIVGDDLESFKTLLRGQGLSESEIDEAVRLAGGGLPKNALKAGGPGGALAKDAARAKSFEERHPIVAEIGGRAAPHTRRKIAQDAASTAGAMSFADRHPDVARVF